MKLIHSSAEYLPQEPGLDGIYKQIELAGRTSYLSYDKITEDSAKKFVDMLIKSRHTSVLEHGTVYLDFSNQAFDYEKSCLIGNIIYSPYTKINETESTLSSTPYFYKGLITTNMRVIYENNCKFLLNYLCEPTEFHEKRLSVKVITDIGVTREFNRHRTFSIVEQSTRYCNLSKDKFGKEITFIKPYWYDQFNKDVDCTGHRKDGASDMYTSRDFEDYLVTAECNYMAALVAGATPQQARAILPLCTKTEAVYTAFESDWARFFSLRLYGETGAPHPQAKALAQIIYDEFKEHGLIERIEEYRKSQHA